MIYQTEVTLTTPLALTQRRATGNDTQTLDYIPGTSLRGAIAAAYLADGGKKADDPAFRALFLEGLARFGSLRLEGADPWPLSTRACKELGMKHPIVDRLLATAAGIDSDVVCQGENSDDTGACGAKVEHPDGYVRLEKKRSRNEYVRQDPEQRRMAHAAIDGVRLTTKSGQLFSVRSLEAGQVFKGRIVAEGKAIGALEALGQRQLRMGRAKTRGQGLVEFKLAKQREAPGVLERERCRERLENLQGRARQIGRRLTNQRVVSVTLLSPALLLDQFLLSHATAHPADVGLSAEWKLLGWYNQTITVTGWHAAARVPRTETAMAAAGSCFLYGTGGVVNPAELAEWAAQLEHMGIGERRAEGFGEVAVCHDVHARYAEGYATAG